jgi:hypothetical protein
MTRFYVVLLASLCVFRTYPAHGQYYYYNDKYYGGDWVVELGGTLGVMNGLTDIGGNKGTGKKFVKDLNWKMTKPSFGLYAIATYREFLGVRLEATFGSVQSYDSILKKVGPSTFGRYERNLSFRSTVRDFQLVAEFHPLFLKIYDESKAPRWSPYVSAGIGYFVFNPQAKLNDQWYYLHPLRTEGEGFAEYPNRKTYSLSQVNIPLGLGVKYEVSSGVSARLEFAYRILFTDYLDDASNKDYVNPSVFSSYLSPHDALIAQQLSDRRISTVINNQRGDPNDNDAFFTIQLKVGFTIRAVRKKK